MNKRKGVFLLLCPAFLLFLNSCGDSKKIQNYFGKWKCNNGAELDFNVKDKKMTLTTTLGKDVITRNCALVSQADEGVLIKELNGGLDSDEFFFNLENKILYVGALSGGKKDRTECKRK